VLTNRPVFKCPVESFFQGNEKFLRGRLEESIRSVNSNQKMDGRRTTYERVNKMLHGGMADLAKRHFKGVPKDIR
jgi:hypothetical protein